MSTTPAAVGDDRLRPLSAAQAARYVHHRALAHVGQGGQERLAAAKVLVVGLGGLGSPVALYLVAAGVGTVGLADPDVVVDSNLQRQVVHTTGEVGRPKVDSAAAHLAALNPMVETVRHPAGLTVDNASRLVAGYDVVVDCTDTFDARYLINDVCLDLATPWVHGAVDGVDGEVSVFVPGSGPCYRCLHRAATPREPQGVLGPLPGIVGAIAATETLKLVLGAPSLVGRVLLVDAWAMSFDEVALTQDPTCPACAP
ncbi:MAG: ThiF family adenylyltransferase [Micrococcales bacterium]|nr:ThiF family adenylyltransferase [Micrococcales bacterium]